MMGSEMFGGLLPGELSCCRMELLLRLNGLGNLTTFRHRLQSIACSQAPLASRVSELSNNEWTEMVRVIFSNDQFINVSSRCIYENNDILVHHDINSHPGNTKEVVMCVMLLRGHKKRFDFNMTPYF